MKNYKRKTLTPEIWDGQNWIRDTFRIGDTTRWYQGGINRWMTGKIVEFRAPVLYENDAWNEWTVIIELSSGKKMYTRGYKLRKNKTT